MRDINHKSWHTCQGVYPTATEILNSLSNIFMCANYLVTSEQGCLRIRITKVYTTTKTGIVNSANLRMEIILFWQFI